MRDIIKKIWKQLSKPLLRVYSQTPSLIIKNEFEPVPESYSQFGQDIYVFGKIFNNKRDGVFVDVGGNHPTKGSNTYLLEKSGWTGIAFEPQDTLRALWKDARKTECLPYLIGPENKLVEFVESKTQDGLSGVLGFNKVTQSGVRTQKEQRRLDGILKERDIAHIDYLSIDVEGYEMQVLESIDFNAVDIRVIDIENDLGFKWVPFVGKYLGSTFGSNELRELLKKHGFKYTARIMGDDIFVKQ